MSGLISYNFITSHISPFQEQSVKKPFICAYNKVIFFLKETFPQKAQENRGT